MAKPKLVKTYKEFMDETDLIPPKMDKDEAIKYNIWYYLWDEYEREAMKERMYDLVKRKGYHIYTLLENNGEDFILDGYWKVNRIGYLISETPVRIGEFDAIEVEDVEVEKENVPA